MFDYPYQKWAEDNLRIQTRSGAEWTVFCLNPDHQESHPSCSFNVEKGVWYCFSCGSRGSLANDEDLEIDIEMDSLKLRLNKMLDGEEEEEHHAAPESMLNRFDVRHPFWESRGINEDTQEIFGLGYDTIADAATIPVRNSTGALAGVTRRFREVGKGDSRYKYPKGFKSVQNVFASWMSDDYDMRTVVKTEGAIDAMLCWQAGFPAVALYGNSVSPQQIRVLLEMGVRKVIDFSDNDLGGEAARERSFGYWVQDRSEGTYTYRADTDMSKHFQMMRVVNYFGVKDAGSMSSAQLTKAIETAQYYTMKKYVPKKRFQPRKRSLVGV